MNKPKTITPAAPAGVIPAASTAQNITVEQRAKMNSSRRGGQAAPVPSAPAKPSVAATTPATAAAPSEGQQPAQPGAEPHSAIAAPPASAAPGLTPADALANAADPGAPDSSPAQPAGEAVPLETPNPKPETGEAHLNGEAPAWLEQVLAGDNTVVPVAIKQMGKRIGELTYRLRIAEDALAANGAPDSDPAQPAGEAGPQPETAPPETRNPKLETTPLSAQVEREWKIIEWCQKNRDGGTVKVKGGGEEQFSAEQVAEQLVASQRKVQDLEKTQSRLEDQHRAQFTQTFQKSRDEATRKYPWMADRTAATPEAKEAKTYIDANPHVLQDPNWPLVVGRYVTGLQAERKATPALPPVAAPMARPRANGAPAPVPGAPPSQAPRQDPKAAELARLNEEFRKTGSVKIKQKIFALQRSMPVGVPA